jgi:hypothetical protein
MKQHDLSNLTIKQGIDAVVAVGKEDLIYIFSKAPSFGKINTDAVDEIAQKRDIDDLTITAALATVASFIDNPNPQLLESSLQGPPYSIDANDAKIFIDVLKTAKGNFPNSAHEYRMNLCLDELDSIYQPSIVQGKWNLFLASSPNFPETKATPYVKVMLAIGQGREISDFVEFYSRSDTFERFVQQMNDALAALKKAEGAH